jgi:hypothetical protein
MWAQKGRHVVRVFAFERKPVMPLSSPACYEALWRAGIENFRWHEQGGTPLFALQELAAWETEKMVRRHAHPAADHLAVYADALESHGKAAAHLTNLYDKTYISF